MARIVIENEWLTVHVTGIDRLLAFKGRIRVPLTHVRGVTTEREAMRVDWRMIRIPGTFIPGIVRAGSYYRIRDGWYFFATHNLARSIAIDLRGEFYKRVVVQVEGETAAEASRRIAAAVDGASA